MCPRRLFESIEEMNIEGDPCELGEMIVSMDGKTQDFANLTEAVKAVIHNFNASNHGLRYEEMCEHVSTYSKQVCEATETINDVQWQIYYYIEKACEYDLRRFDTISPHNYDVDIIDVSVNVDKLEFHREDMLRVVDIIMQYIEESNHIMIELNRDCDAIGGIWKDEQYDLFKDYVDEVNGMISTGRKRLDEYNEILIDIINRT